MVEWFRHEGADHYKQFITNCIGLYLNELANDYLNKDKDDISNILRGRIYQLRDILGMPDQISAVDKMKATLSQLEAEGYTKDKEPSGSTTQKGSN